MRVDDWTIEGYGVHVALLASVLVFTHMTTLFQKLWAICDIILNLILTKTTNFDMKEFPAETRIPQMYFRKNDDPVFINTKCYLPIEVQMQYQQPKKGITMSLVLDKGTKRVRGRPKQSSQGMGIDEQDVKQRMNQPVDRERTYTLMCVCILSREVEKERNNCLPRLLKCPPNNRRKN
uniref:(California timema) hypothetical protein n=1 Tax=Timema californicum TaxID=61474 RepID=A0A7R9JG17_TIMCA|nr:unnamed protein product [Timema californicum]